MTAALASRGPAVAAPPTVLSLQPEDVPSLRLPGGRGQQAMREALLRAPGRSVWIPETLEFALLGAWRHRREIAYLEELVAVRHVQPLLQTAFERCVERGDDLLLAIELESGHRESRFARAGLELLEAVITYEIGVASAPRPAAPNVRLVPIRQPDPRSLARLVALDHAAFPWLWRNSAEEFASYLRLPGVDVSIVERDGVPIGYVGATLFTGWGHLDRIAVAPELQGQGIGRAALTLLIDRLRQQGARRVGLSTQRTNAISQRLYHRLGFERTPALDYQLFGAWCGADMSQAD